MGTNVRPNITGSIYSQDNKKLVVVFKQQNIPLKHCILFFRAKKEQLEWTLFWILLPVFTLLRESLANFAIFNYIIATKV